MVARTARPHIEITPMMERQTQDDARHPGAFMAGGGKAGALMRSVDWASTPLGPVEAWPDSLKTTVGTLLHSRHPMFLWWGPDLIQFYNDAYLPSFGHGKHPAAMGQRGRECWQEIWPTIWPQIDDVMSRGRASWNEDHLVPIFRNGRMEEVYWTYGYSPVFDEHGGVGGTLVVCTETTSRVIGQRRLRTLRNLAEKTNFAPNLEAVLDSTRDLLGSVPEDVVFALMYLEVGDGTGPVLVRSVGLDDDACATLHAAFGHELARFRHLGTPVPMPPDMNVTGSAWPEPVSQVFVAPVAVEGSADASGYVVFGLSPRLPLDPSYREHLCQLAAHVAQAQARVAALHQRDVIEASDRFLVELDDAVRPLSDPEEITFTAARALGQHLRVNRCAYATVEDDEDTFLLTGNYNDGVHSIVGRYTFTQFGEECLRLMRAGEPYVVCDSETDPRITDRERPSYHLTAIRAVVCVPIRKAGRFVAAMAVHATRPRVWESHEIELVQHVASRCWESIERARVTASLRESERQFRELANSIANLAWMARPDGSIYWYNDQWYAYTGTTAEDMEGWGWQRVHDPDVLPAVLERWTHSIATGVPFEMVFPIRGADGAFRRFLTRVNPVRDSQGRVVHWFGTNTDVENERRATEVSALLRERERVAREDAELQKRLLHSLFMQAPTLITVLRGPDHVIELANPPICRVWGQPEADLVNRPLLEALPDIGGQAFGPLLDGVYRTGVPHVGKETPATFERAGGRRETLYFDFVYSPFRNVEGQIEGVFVVASDVTDQVLARQQLDQLRRAAEGANRAKDEFLAMLGHELRNPLSPILTALHLMRLRGNDSSERERTVIERQVTHLTRLVDDLLDVSRIARGKVELKEEVIEMADIVGKAIEMASPLLEQRTHLLTVRVPRHDLAVRGDGTRLAQVASNLLTNAAKYTPPGGTITIEAEEALGDVVLRVRDTGMGIRPDVLPRIFDLFVQETQAIDRAQGGLGLGLTIVRNLVERHHGSVSAHSEGPGRGSEFVVRLPRVTSTIPESASIPAAAAGGTPQPASHARRILVVDDNQDAAEMLAGALQNKGFETQVAHDAPAALRLAQTFIPDIAFIDIGLPVMDGYELAERLRQVPGLERIRLVALTGYGQESDRVRSRAAGFHEHLVKPVDFAAVEQVVHV
jgi:PAS domain S-box-containing protein